MGPPEIVDGVFVVLGGSGDLGSHVARQLRNAGKQVLLASRGSNRLNQLATELSASKCELDATRFDDVEACFAAARKQFGRIYGAVNCVVSLLLKPAHLTRDMEWQETVSTNLTSAFATVRAAAKTMSDDGGSVVLISSAAARIGLPGHEAIAAAKAGIIGLARSAAASYAGRNLRFNAVAPGLMKTKLTRKIWENSRTSATSTSMHAVGRLGEAAEVAELVCWLLLPNSSWVTGEVFSIDGGLANVLASPRKAHD